MDRVCGGRTVLRQRFSVFGDVEPFECRSVRRLHQESEWWSRDTTT